MATNFTDVELQEQATQNATQPRTVQVTLTLSESALRQVRAGFNPDRLTAVGNFHMLCAGLITALEHYRDAHTKLIDAATDTPVSVRMQVANDAARNAAIAITHIETGCMYAVKAASAEIYASKVR